MPAHIVLRLVNTNLVDTGRTCMIRKGIHTHLCQQGLTKAIISFLRSDYRRNLDRELYVTRDCSPAKSATQPKQFPDVIIALTLEQLQHTSVNFPNTT